MKEGTGFAKVHPAEKDFFCKKVGPASQTSNSMGAIQFSRIHSRKDCAKEKSGTKFAHLKMILQKTFASQ